MTSLNIDDVVALNALIVTAIGLSFAFSSNRDRKRRERPHLNLGGPRRRTALDDVARGRALVKHSGSEPYGAAALRRLESEEQLSAEESMHSRQLNVFFNWNGHTWDAFEVLGVPAGAGRDQVIEAFHYQRQKSPDSTAFLQAAADAILKR